VYWICPLVEESEAEGIEHLTNATERFESLQKRFGERVGLVHGQMKGADKDRVMAQFAAHEIGLLVATTVVEVGVDVPAATIMVIENAERFGLAQLHQLRGRIGRGSEASTCLLLYREPLNEMSTARLKVIRETTHPGARRSSAHHEGQSKADRCRGRSATVFALSVRAR
jgi:ATP-dependent DNA helicase RecG